MHIKDMLTQMGFEVANTGGGCQGLELVLPNGFSLFANPTIVFENRETDTHVVVEGKVV